MFRGVAVAASGGIYGRLTIAGVLGVFRRFARLGYGCSGVPQEQIIFIDDLAANIDAARAAGLQAVQFTSIEQLLADFEQFGLEL